MSRSRRATTAARSRWRERPHRTARVSQFFIVLSDSVGTILASYNTYAIFGKVTSGMETIDAIYAAADAESPTNPIAMDSVTVTTP